MPSGGLFTNYNVEQIFIGENWYFSKKYTNDTGNDLVLGAGTVLGTIFASNKWNLMKSTNSDGSQIPTAIFYTDKANVTIPDGATVTLEGCVRGYVNQNALKFALNTDTIDTPVGSEGTGGVVQDLIRRAGPILVPSIQLSITDPNQP